MVCPECQQGKHQNCDGIAYLEDDDTLIRCDCDDNAPHPLNPDPMYITPDDEGDNERISKWEGK